MTDRRDHRQVQALISGENVTADFDYHAASLGKMAKGVQGSSYRPKVVSEPI